VRGPSAPVTAIAKRLGVSHAALLQRVGSKEQLLLRSMCAEQPQIYDRLRERPPDRGARSRLMDILQELQTFHAKMLPGLLVLRAAGLGVEATLGDREPAPGALRRMLARWLARAAR
jgi:AcrR family transcriptional regulator